MLSFLKRLVLLATVIVLAVAGGVVWWAQQPVSLAASPLEVVIKPNSSVVSVGKQLANAGVGVQPQLFSLVARATGNAKSLKAGGYAFVALRKAAGELHKTITDILLTAAKQHVPYGNMQKRQEMDHLKYQKQKLYLQLLVNLLN